MRSRSGLWIAPAILPGLCLAAWGDQTSRPMDLHLIETIADWRSDMLGGEVAHYAVIGDSISFRADTFVWFLRDFLEADYGNAGDGYLALGPGFQHAANGTRNRRPGLTFTTSEEWVEVARGHGDRSERARLALDGIYTRIGATGWVRVTFFGPDATLHFVREVGAGTIRIEVEGDEIAEIDASLETGSPILGTFTFPTGQSDPDTPVSVTFSLVGATEGDPQWTQLNGLHMRTGEPGVMFSRFARSGETPGLFLQCDPALFADTLIALNPDMVVMMSDGTAEEAYEQTMPELLDRVEQAVPDAEILLASHHHFGNRPESDMLVLIDIARLRGHGFLNLFDLHDSREHLHDLGFLHDNVHFSAKGGEWFGRYFFHAMQGWTIPTQFAVRFGDQIEGDLYETRATDDDRLTARARPYSFLEPHVLTFEARFFTDIEQPSTIDISSEWFIDETAATATYSLRNWTTGRFEPVATDSVGLIERIFRFDDLDAGPYVNPDDGSIDLQVRTVSYVTQTFLGFDAFIDHLQMRVE